MVRSPKVASSPAKSPESGPADPQEATEADRMTERMEDLVTSYLIHPQAVAQEQLADQVNELFQEMTEDEDKLAIFGFFPQALTQRHIVEVLGIERKHGKSSIAQNLRTVVPEMEFGSVDEKRQALLHIHESLRARVDPDNYWQRESQAVLIELLRTFGQDASSKLADLDAGKVEQLAARCTLNHFRLGMRMGQRPETWVFDRVCTLSPVRALQTSRDAEHVLLHELLSEIFAEGRCQQYMTFYTKNKELVEKKWGLSNDELTRQVRTLTLCTLCVRSTESLRRGDPAVVPYAKIAASLCVGFEDVERYVIEARSLGLLNAKIDAMDDAIVVKSAHHPLLGRDDWRRVREKLNLWREATDKLMIILDEVRMQQVKEDKEQERMEAQFIDRQR